MPDTIAAVDNPRAVLGDNLPPLADQLVEETADLQKRADDLVAAAGRAAIIDEETAGKAVLLAKMLKEHASKINEAREVRKKPFLDGGRAVDQHYSAMANPVITTMAHVVKLVDAYRRQKEAEAAAERRRLELEAQRQREAAEAAARAQREAEERERQAAEAAARRVREAEAAAAASANKAEQEAAARARADQQRQEAEASQRRMAAELEQRRAADAAAELDRQAAASVAAPIDSGMGVRASGRKVTVVTITDWKKAAHGALKLGEADMKAEIQKIYDRLARAKVRDLPGATVTEDSATQIR